MVSVLQWCAFALYIALALALVAKYMRTRDPGFIWLGAAVILWPLCAYWLNRGEATLLDRVIHGQPVGVYPFNLISERRMTVAQFVRLSGSVEQLIGAALLLVAVLFLSRPNREPAPPVPAAPERDLQSAG
jgi:hypothetical protein